MDPEEHFRAILDRIDNPSPLEQELADLLEQGKREQLLAGVDSTGHPFAPLARSTLRNRPGTGPPLAPQFDRSAIVTGYQVTVTVGPARITLSAGWPYLSWVRYHRTGTRRMPRRDPSGFREQDKATVVQRFKEWIIHGR